MNRAGENVGESRELAGDGRAMLLDELGPLLSELALLLVRFFLLEPGRLSGRDPCLQRLNTLGTAIRAKRFHGLQFALDQRQAFFNFGGEQVTSRLSEL